MGVSTQVYYWPREFVLRSHAFVQPRSYRRASISLLLASEGQFCIELEGQGVRQFAGLVLGPLTERKGLRFAAKSFRQAGWIIDISPGSAAHRGLLDWLQHSPARILDEASLASIRALLAVWQDEPELPLAAAKKLHGDLIACLLQERAHVRCDPRVAQALALLDAAALDEMAIASLAQQVNLSESRLRSLVRRELGCNLAQYARWSAAWKTILHWHPGRTLTDAAHAAGFHDLAHANHAANDLFGMSPSRALDQRLVALFTDSTVKM